VRVTNIDGSGRLASTLVLSALVLGAVALRAYRLGSPLLWVDEAESSINALTIVADGVPGSHYLGQPLYENTLVRPWPENAQYEFRDLSYSDRNLAVYHAWLPLYAIAAAFRLAGVTAEAARHGTPLRDASPAEIYRWTAVPRLPALAFSALFVVAAWGLGRRLHGPPAGVAFAFAVATSSFVVWLGRQARYYSATLALNAVCGLAIWNACRRGRWSDHLLAGLAVGALFHVHALSAITMVALYAAALPLARRQPRLWLRLLAAGSVSGVLVLPWAVWSGLLSHTSHIPPARHYVGLRMLIGSLPSKHVAVLATAGLGVAWFTATALLGDRLGARWRWPSPQETAAFYFALAWLTLAYIVFVALIPAASYFPDRLKLITAVPGLLLLTLVVAAASRALRPEWGLLPVAAMMALLVVSGQFPPRIPPLLSEQDEGVIDLVGLLRSWTLAPGGRIFASSNDHLMLTYYSGRLVQSISPVRKKWLDELQEDLVVIEGARFEMAGRSQVLAMARRQHRDLSPAEVRSRAEQARRFTTAVDLRAAGVSVVSAPTVRDELDRALVETTRGYTRKVVTEYYQNTPIGEFASPTDWLGFRRDFFYMLVEPHRRVGPGLNYAACRDNGEAYVHASGFVVFDCRRVRRPALMSAALAKPEP
jgi:hypothetical protein